MDSFKVPRYAQKEYFYTLQRKNQLFLENQLKNWTSLVLNYCKATGEDQIQEKQLFDSCCVNKVLS